MPPQSLSLTWTHQELLKFWNWIKNTKSYDICHLMCFSYKFQGEMLSLRISTWFTFENWKSLSYLFWAHCVIQQYIPQVLPWIDKFWALPLTSVVHFYRSEKVIDSSWIVQATKIKKYLCLICWLHSQQYWIWASLKKW